MHPRFTDLRFTDLRFKDLRFKDLRCKSVFLLLFRFSSMAVFAAALFASVTPPALLRAQETTPVAQNSSPAGATNETQPSGEESKNEKEPKQGAGSDNIRNAPAVRWIAEKSGLSLNTAYWLCVVLNFAIVFFSLAALMQKKLPAMFRNRSQMIQQRIEEARKTGEEARRRLDDVEGRLSRLDSEIAGMRREAEENAQAEESRVLAAVQEESARIVASAEQEIRVFANAARRDLKNYAVALAVDLAEDKIRVGKDTDQMLVREFTTHLGKDGN